MPKVGKITPGAYAPKPPKASDRPFLRGADGHAYAPERYSTKPQGKASNVKSKVGS